MIKTPRLTLRQWSSDDLAPFADLNGDPEAMRFFPATLTREESDTLVARFREGITERGWGFWAVELTQTGEFVGCVGLHPQPDKFPFSPCIEIGWRLAKSFWHQGFAQEAATACLTYAANELHLDEVVSFTTIHNLPSEQLMQRLGMEKRGEFLHPALPAEHPLARHVLYSISLT
ncbi:acetyltransferase, GNAT family [Lelliottia jeotgali]|nr:acetyltransferase, GNAT family [Lelliottia jeotgali]